MQSAEFHQLLYSAVVSGGKRQSAGCGRRWTRGCFLMVAELVELKPCYFQCVKRYIFIKTVTVRQ